MKLPNFRALLALTWIVVVLFVYAVFVDYVRKPDFLVTILKVVFGSFKAEYLK